MPRHSFIAPLLVSTALVACASTPQGDTVEGALRNGDVCPTLDYGATAPASEYYRRFASDDEAEAYLRAVIASGQLAGQSGPDAALRGISQDARLTRLVSEVFDGFRKAYPKETADLIDPPRVAIVESSIVNAFALGPGFVDSETARRDQSPWLFIVHTALLKHEASDTEMRGLFAHEMGHLILRTFLPEIQRKVRATYVLRGSEDHVIGEGQDDDPNAVEHVEQILKIQTRIGGLPSLGLAMLQGYYPKLLKSLVATAADPAPASCASAKANMKELHDAQVALVPDQAQGNFVPRTPTAEEQTKLDGLSASVSEDLRNCAPDVKESLLELIASISKLPREAVDPSHPQHAELLSHMLDAELQADAENPDASLVDRLLRAEVLLRAELSRLRGDAAFPIDRIRVFDYEEDADDAAVRVLAAIGDDPKGLGNFLLSLMPDAAKKSCLSDVASRKPISYGQLIDTHPATCWRYYHAIQFGEALAACTPSGAKTAPRGAGRPSVVETLPREEVEPGYGRGL